MGEEYAIVDSFNFEFRKVDSNAEEVSCIKGFVLLVKVVGFWILQEMRVGWKKRSLQREEVISYCKYIECSLTEALKGSRRFTVLSDR